MLRRRKRPLWTPTVAATGWGESTFAEQAWDKSRNAGMRWAIAGLIAGTLLALVARRAAGLSRSGSVTSLLAWTTSVRSAAASRATRPASFP